MNTFDTENCRALFKAVISRTIQDLYGSEEPAPSAHRGTQLKNEANAKAAKEAREWLIEGLSDAIDLDAPHGYTESPQGRKDVICDGANIDQDTLRVVARKALWLKEKHGVVLKPDQVDALVEMLSERGQKPKS